MTRDISSSSTTCPCTMPSMEPTRMDSLMCFILMEVNHRGHLDILYETWALFGFYVKNLEFVSFAKEIFKPMGVCMRKKLISIWIEFKTLLEGKTCDKPILNSLVPHRISLTVWCGKPPPPSPVLTYTPGWKEVQCTLSILLKNTTGWTLSGYEPWPLNLQSAMLILDISTIGKLPVFMVYWGEFIQLLRFLNERFSSLTQINDALKFLGAKLSQLRPCKLPLYLMNCCYHWLLWVTPIQAIRDSCVRTMWGNNKNKFGDRKGKKINNDSRCFWLIFKS